MANRLIRISMTVVVIGLLYGAFVDLGAAILVALYMVMFVIILREIYLLRNTVSQFFARAVSDNWFIRVLLGSGIINFFLALMGSVYFSLNLLIYSSLARWADYVILIFAAFAYGMAYRSYLRSSANVFKTGIGASGRKD